MPVKQVGWRQVAKPKLHPKRGAKSEMNLLIRPSLVHEASRANLASLRGRVRLSWVTNPPWPMLVADRIEALAPAQRSDARRFTGRHEPKGSGGGQAASFC